MSNEKCCPECKVVNFEGEDYCTDTSCKCHTPSTDTIAEIRKSLELHFAAKHSGATNDFLGDVKDALQKRNEELVGKVEAIEVVGDKEENKGIADIYRQIWDTSFKPIVLNIVQQP